MKRKCAKTMRLAGQLWNRYKTDGMFQDLVETGALAGVGAAYQGLFTDMTPEEIALGAAISGGVGLAARPLAARGGYALGKKVDDARGIGPLSKSEFMAASLFPGNPTNVRLTRERLGERNPLTQIMEAKYNQNFVRPDGSERGMVEGALGSTGRLFGDNIAQLSLAGALPFLLAKEEESLI